LIAQLLVAFSLLGAYRLSLFRRLHFTPFNAGPVLAARRDEVGEHVGVIAIVMTVRKLVQIEREIILRDLVIGADHSALNQAPEGLQIVCMDVPANVLATSWCTVL